VRLWSKAYTRTMLLHETGDGTPSDTEEVGHLAQAVIVSIIEESYLLS
jgi:hypothetical protein